MSADTQNTDMVPELVFGDAKPVQEQAIAEVNNAADSSLERLTPEEQKLAQEFADKIDIRDSNGVMQYGAGAQKKLSDFSEDALQNVRTKDLGEIGELLSNVVTELKDFDKDDDKKGGLFGLFKKAEDKIVALKRRYETTEVQINRITDALEGYQVQLLKDIAILDAMYDQNLAYFKELNLYIEAGKLKIAQARENELPALLATAQESGTAEDAQAARDFDAMIVRMEKKVHDLELTRTIALQTAPQIRLVQDSDTMMAEKIQSTLVNTIPLWKSQMVLALGVEHVGQAAEAQRQVSEMTNELLKKNAEKLKTATVEAAKESERGIVDIETLKNTNDQLISTLDEVMRIQTEGREKRVAAEAELRTIEEELKQKLVNINR